MTRSILSRRHWIHVAGLAAGGALLGCRLDTTGPGGDARLVARPRSGITPPPNTNKFAINVDGTDAMMFVPQVVAGATGAPLLVFLHGAGRTVEPFVDAFGPVAEANGVIVLAPFARGQTWDRIFGRFGSDVVRINSTLEYVFERWPIDPQRIVLSGFSDGATYALAMGRANGDLFSRLVAFAPGILFNVNAVGRPPVLVTHGTRDQVLSYAKTSQQIVPSLVQLGYDVDFRSFTGDHVVPLSVVNEVFSDLGAG